jgi:hypothetical protein
MMGVFALVLFITTGIARAGALSGDTPVYYNGGKRGHIEGCRRLSPEAKAAGPTMTLAEMEAKGGRLCSRCPGSELNIQRTGGGSSSSGGSSVKAAELPGNTPVYYGGGKRGHVEGCRRLSPEAIAKGPTMTLAEMQAKGAMLCSRCPGSKLNVQREAKAAAHARKMNTQFDPDPKDPKTKYGRKGWKARQARLKEPEQTYAPDTPAVCDALWMRVHEVDCPELILKEHKKVITLEQADREGWRIGENGQSGRGNCCFKGYRRKHPEKGFTKDTVGIVQTMKSGKFKWHQAGCHRFSVGPDQRIQTPAEAAADATANNVQFYMCIHCIERGPSVASVDPVKLKTMATDGSEPTPFLDPLANVEEFMGWRFFFDYSKDYKTYRATGDKSALSSLLEDARYYHKLYEEYPSAAKAKASDPEHWNYLFPMVGWSRITLQLARKYPSQVSPKEIAEAEAFLNAAVAALKPVVEGNSNLDPAMGIPQGLADDFRSRAYNRAANGIGTLATLSKALEDLQAIQDTTSYQPTIDRYRKSVEEWVKNWENMGCMYTEADGKTYFYYAYAGTGKKRADGLMLGSADDVGHYAHCVMGATLIWEATPELGVDDDFMTAIANAVYHNSTTKNGSVQAPSADRIQPLSRKEWSKGPKPKLYVFEAFRDGLIAGQNRHMDAETQQKAASLARNPNTHWGYFKALRRNRSLIHVGEKL